MHYSDNVILFIFSPAILFINDLVIISLAKNITSTSILDYFQASTKLSSHRTSTRSLNVRSKTLLKISQIDFSRVDIMLLEKGVGMHGRASVQWQE